MWKNVLRASVFVLVVLVLTPSMFGEAIEVRRSANVRSEPNRAAEVLDRPEIGTQLALVEPDQTNGYYHVSLPDGTRGWVYRTLVARIEREPVRPVEVEPTDLPSPGHSRRTL